MAKLGGAFNAQAIAPADPDGGGYFPVGLIRAVITGNSIEANANNAGSRVDFSFKGVDGPGLGIEGKARLNMFYQGADATKSGQARDIAAKQLSAICHATGVYDLGPDGDLDRLTGKPLVLVVESQNDMQHPDRTNIVGFADVNGMKPGQPTVPVRPREAAAPQAAAPAPQPAAWQPPAAAPAPQAANPAAAVAFGPSSAAAPVAQPGFAAPAPAAAPAAPVWGGAAAGAAAGAAPAQAAAPAAGVPSWASR